MRVDFDRRLKLEFHGSKITSDAGLLAYRELDDGLGLTDLGGAALSNLRRGKNTRLLLTGLLRQSVYGRLAGYEDVNDAERLSRVPAMRAIVDRKGLDRRAASTSQMGRFETESLATEENLAALTNLSGLWIGRVHDCKKPKIKIGAKYAPRPLPHFPDGRSRDSSAPLCRDPALDRRSATLRLAAMTGVDPNQPRSLTAAPMGGSRPTMPSRRAMSAAEASFSSNKPHKVRRSRCNASDQGRLHPGLPFMQPFQRTGRFIREIPVKSYFKFVWCHGRRALDPLDR